MYDWIGLGKINAEQKIKLPSCGGCHPGGGALEYPRKADGTADYSMNLIEAEQLQHEKLDGDFFAHSTPDKKSHFTQSGLLEADCMICHHLNYNFGARFQQITARNYRWAATVGAGLGKVTGKIFTYADNSSRPGSPDFWQGTWNFERRPMVNYNWKNQQLFTASGQLRGQNINKMVASKNCLQCHKGPDAKKTGWIHAAEYDVHAKLGFQCIDCHGLVGNTKKERMQHQIAKGWHPLGTVRDDLDGKGMQTCEACHLQGAYRPRRANLPAEAKNPTDAHNEKFEDVEFHLEMISCSACHATRQPGNGGYLIDMSTGSQIWYTASALEVPEWSDDFGGLAAEPWQPWIAKYDPKSKTESELYTPMVPKVVQWFGERVERGEVRPIRLDLVNKAFQAVKSKIGQVEVRTTSGKVVQKPLVVSEADIKLMIQQIEKSGLKDVVFVRDKVYQLKNGRIMSYDDHQVAHSHDFPIHHNILAIESGTVLGSKGAPEGCADCHSQNASFFTKMKVIDVGGFLKNSYPNPQQPYAIPMYEVQELDEVPESGFEEE
ncbi:hypothetical protein JW964_14320 [candidate division KSB1 bacterium]|nr:hypothetical protein [candidate division KSB1 bacterium]